MKVTDVLGGRYTLQGQLGAGGMAVVWRARDEVLGRHVAVKVLAGRHVGDPVSRRRIWDEARAAAVLSHPNIAQVHDFGESQAADGTCTPYVVMELVPGGTLSERIAAGPLPVAAALRICAEVAAALAAAHADGLVHRDIKPANVMVTPAGAKVVDFGIAAAISSDGGVEPNGERFGTPAYLAPERLLADAVEPASDVYALGLMLYRLLAGHPPWSVDTTTKMLAAHVYVEPAPLPQLPKVPHYVTDLVNRCLLKDPTSRPTAGDIAAVLARAATVVGDPVAAAHPTDVPPPAAAASPAPLSSVPLSSVPAAPARSRRRRVLVVCGAVLAVAIAGLFWLVLPANRPTAQVPGAAQADSGPRGSEAGPAGVVPTDDADRLAPSTGAATAPGVSATLPVGLPGAGAAQPVGGGNPGDPGVGNPGPGDPGPGSPESTVTARPAPPRPTATVDEPAPPQQRTLSATEGSVTARCTSGGDAELLSWTPVKPYKVKSVAAGPAAAPSVQFKHGNRVATMTVTCASGVPSADVT